jgi:hypothetical protein
MDMFKHVCSFSKLDLEDFRHNKAIERVSRMTTERPAGSGEWTDRGTALVHYSSAGAGGLVRDIVFSVVTKDIFLVCAPSRVCGRGFACRTRILAGKLP